MEVGLGPGDIDECGEEDRHLYGSTSDDVPDEAREGDPSGAQKGAIPSGGLITEGGVDCIDGCLCNVVCGGVDEWGVLLLFEKVRTGEFVGHTQFDEFQDCRGVDGRVWGGWWMHERGGVEMEEGDI